MQINLLVAPFALSTPAPSHPLGSPGPSVSGVLASLCQAQVYRVHPSCPVIPRGCPGPRLDLEVHLCLRCPCSNGRQEAGDRGSEAGPVPSQPHGRRGAVEGAAWRHNPHGLMVSSASDR